MPHTHDLAAEYPPASWILDFRAVMALRDQGDAPSVLRESLYKRNPDSPNAEEYERRFSAAYIYLRRHLLDFDVRPCAVVSEDGPSLLTDYLFYALYLLYIQVPLPMIDQDFDPSLIIHSATKAEKENPRG